MTLDHEPGFVLRKIGLGRAVVRNGLLLLLGAFLIVLVSVALSSL